MFNKNKKIILLLKLNNISNILNELLSFIISMTLYLYLFKESNFLILFFMFGFFYLLYIVLNLILNDFFISKILRNKIKEEYIKENKEIGYIKYIPESEILNIEEYLYYEKNNLEKKLEQENLKINISNF